MTPSPNLQELIEIVHTDSPSADALAQLGQAAQTVNDLEEVSDALLGHFVDRCRRSGRSWSEISSVLGVSKQAAHKRFASPLSSGAPTFERFTERARAVLGGAAEEARALRQRFVGTEHLLLALFEPAESVAAQILREVGIEKPDIETKVTAVSERGGEPVTDEAPMPFTPRAIEALRHAVEEALKLGHNYIGTEHLLLALFGDADALASRVLTSSGATYEDVARRVDEKLAGFKR